MHTSSDLLYQLALTCVPQIGPIQARILLDHFEHAEAIFRSKLSFLEKIEGIGTIRAKNIKQFRAFQEQEDAIREIEKNKVQPLFIKDAAYPRRLLHCYDPPILLFYKGNANLNSSRVLSFIGTRNHTEYGRTMTEQLLEELTPYSPLIISGLAYGIDAIAHKKSMQNSLPTVGVLGHGLDTIYPSAHASLAREMLSTGGLLSEFRCKTQPDRHHFPSRNRIVAGISDATIVIETAVKGGSMITANLACDYHRDVFALPGKATDVKSGGCNQLIAQQKAQLIQSGKEIADALGWIEKAPVSVTPRQLFIEVSDDERALLNILENGTPTHIDTIYGRMQKSNSHTAALLLQLEIKGMLRCLPGKQYQLIL